MNCNRKKSTGILLFLMMLSLLFFAGCTPEDPAVPTDPEKPGTPEPYVRMEECFDGVEIVIRNVDDPQICGGELIFRDYSDAE
ncbi:MAG: hypothetical protein ACI4JN_03095 [Ruminococcus sp.]